MLCSSAFATEAIFPTFTRANGRQQIDVADFTFLGPVFAEMLIKMCVFSQEIVNASIAVFNTRKYASATLTPEPSLLTKANLSLNTFHKQIPSTFRQLLQAFRDNSNGNQLLTVSFTNARFYRYGVNGSVGFISNDLGIYWTYRFDSTCNCGTSSTSCAMSVMRYFETNGNPLSSFNIPLNYSFNGIALACNPLESVLYSTYECLFNTICVTLLYLFFTLGLVNFGNSFVFPNITALHYTPPSIFTPNTTIVDIINALMIERWTSNINFERYFDQCHPTLCVYTSTPHFDLVNTMVTVIGFAGGGSVALRILSPIIIAFVRRNHTQGTPIVRFTETTERKKSAIH